MLVVYVHGRPSRDAARWGMNYAKTHSHQSDDASAVAPDELSSATGLELFYDASVALEPQVTAPRPTTAFVRVTRDQPCTAYALGVAAFRTRNQTTKISAAPLRAPLYSVTYTPGVLVKPAVNPTTRSFGMASQARARDAASCVGRHPPLSAARIPFGWSKSPWRDVYVLPVTLLELLSARISPAEMSLRCESLPPATCPSTTSSERSRGWPWSGRDWGDRVCLGQWFHAFYSVVGHVAASEAYTCNTIKADRSIAFNFSRKIVANPRCNQTWFRSKPYPTFLEKFPPGESLRRYLLSSGRLAAAGCREIQAPSDSRYIQRIPLSQQVLRNGGPESSRRVSLHPQKEQLRSLSQLERTSGDSDRKEKSRG
ncbi:hypothetical protein ON010_g10660 [Phytophthora cinnamomi]|nr:hypothetical protein ON010_g10660 [Phytophthora cinnamomi]